MIKRTMLTRNEQQSRRLRGAILEQSIRQNTLGGLILVFIAFGFLCFYGLRPIRSGKDREGAMPRQAVARVISVFYQKMPSRPTPVGLRIGKYSALTATFLPVRVGQLVRVLYFIDRSGQIVVEEVDPIVGE